MASADQLPPKKDVGRALLLRGSVFVHLDPRGQDVEVPPHLKDQPQLVLQIGLDLPIPIPDLRVDDSGVFGTLSFNRSPFTCTVPWEAVFALVGEDGRGMVWPESMPSEIAAEVEREAGRRAPVAPGLDGDDGAGSESSSPSEPLVGDEQGKVVSLDAHRPRPPGTALARLTKDDGEEELEELSSSLEEERVEEDRDPPEEASKGPETTDEGRRRNRRGRELPPYLKVVK